MENDEYVQPILVATNGGHAAAIAAAATASVAAWPVTDPRLWQPWLAGRFTKTVRRAKPGPFSRLAPDADATAYIGGVQAAAWAPCTYADLDPRIGKLQVSGTVFDRSGDTTADRGAPGLHLLVDEKLTTGKACAQGAHAAWLWALAAGPASAAAWVADPAIHVHLVPDVAAAGLDWTVVDAGLTEVDPGSTTAASWWVP